MCRRNDSPYRSTFQSTLSMRRATRRYRVHRNSGRISIHALHEESDLTLKNLSFNNRIFQSTLSMRRATLNMPAPRLNIPISIHALHEESDMSESEIVQWLQFQSTLSMRRATWCER